MRTPTVGIVTVTYDSGRFFSTYLRSVEAQSQPPAQTVVVDSGSPDAGFLLSAQDVPSVQVLRERNVGFAAGSNLGWRLVRERDYVLFLNPDAFPAPEFLARATAYLEANPDVGMVSPTLIRYDIAADRPLDVVDTTGVVRTRAGLLAERDQGQPLSVLERYREPNEVPWLCAAMMLARKEALEAVIEGNDELFDESFFMYKEDTDLSWRIRRAGWKLMHHPGCWGITAADGRTGNRFRARRGC